MLALALIVWQALGFPEVEGPIPDRIGLEYLFELAGAGGVIGGMASFIAWPRRRERFIAVGTVVGFAIGAGFYALSLVVQLLFGS
ncbi:MAG: hypothetical protein ACTHN7_03855 [Solirubrobacterales bacterium]